MYQGVRITNVLFTSLGKYLIGGSSGDGDGRGLNDSRGDVCDASSLDDDCFS